MSCPMGAPEISEEKYTQHMQTQHPGGQIASVIAKKNIPNTPSSMPLPPGINSTDLPTPEFIATVEEMKKAEEKPKLVPQPIPTAKINISIEPEVLELKYEWVGQCDKCAKPIETLSIMIAGKCSVIAWCQIHKQRKYHVLPPLTDLYKEENGK